MRFYWFFSAAKREKMWTIPLFTASFPLIYWFPAFDHFGALLLTSVFYASVLLLNIVKVAVFPRGENRVDPQTTLTILWRNSLSKDRRIKNRHQFVFYDNKLSNCGLSLADAPHEFQIHVSVRILTLKISQWVRVKFCSYRKKTN